MGDSATSEGARVFRRDACWGLVDREPLELRFGEGDCTWEALDFNILADFGRWAEEVLPDFGDDD